MASGSVQLPRFTLLESGSLLISPSHLSDAGTYTCMASNSRGIDEASADLLVWGRYISPFSLHLIACAANVQIKMKNSKVQNIPRLLVKSSLLEDA